MTATTSTIALPLTLSSAYFGDTKSTQSTNPQTLRKLVSDLRRGDGDTIQITDAEGVFYDLTDLGRGPELVRNGTCSHWAMTITTKHSSSSHGIPVILDDDGSVMDYGPGVKAIRDMAGMTTQQLADAIGVSRRTVEGWESGRMPSVLALRAMAAIVACD